MSPLPRIVVITLLFGVRPSAELEQEGLTREQLVTDIGDKLRKAGITLDDNAGEFLGLSMRSARIQRGPYTISFDLGLYQVANLSRDKTIKTVAETWGTQAVLSVPPKLFNRISRNTVGELVDHFIGVYLEMNAK
jgi:hypothetical protein